MYTRRGKAKYLGGVGTKVTGKTKRKFRPNIHTVTAMVDGSMQRIKISAKAIRNGKLVRPLKRKFTYKPGQAAGAAPATAGEQTAGQTPAA
jgi:large subunit ribosomal protein L28